METLGKRSFAQVMNAATKIKEASRDIRVSNSMIYMKDGSLLHVDEKKSNPLEPYTPSGKDWAYTDWAFGQLCAKLGVPGRYMEKCMTNGEEALAKSNINTWLRKTEKDYLIRTTDDHIRGILSDKYSVCDAPQLLEAVKKSISTLQNMSGMEMKGSFINEERLHLRMAFPDQLIQGEDLFPALFIDSSDVGRCAIRIYFGIYKLACTNGLIVARAGGQLYLHRHFGIQPETMQEEIAAKMADIPFLIEHAADWVKLSKEKKEDNTTEAFKKRIKEMLNISKKETDNIISLMDNKYDATRWGLVNSITEAAQGFTLDKRIEMEEIAGRLLLAA